MPGLEDQDIFGVLACSEAGADMKIVLANIHAIGVVAVGPFQLDPNKAATGPLEAPRIGQLVWTQPRLASFRTVELRRCHPQKREGTVWMQKIGNRQRRDLVIRHAVVMLRTAFG